MNRHDGTVAVTVFVLALLTKPDYALLIGVVMSLMFFLWKTMHPRIVQVTKDPEFNMFVDADLTKKPGCPQILQLRSENAIYFANAEYTIEHISERFEEYSPAVKFLLLDFQAVSFIDITGIDELRRLHDKVKARGAELALMDVHLPVKQVINSSGMIDELKPGYLIEKKGEAISLLFKNIDHKYCKNVCPYKLYLECETIK